MLTSDQTVPLIPNSVRTITGDEVIYHCDAGYVFNDSPATKEMRFPITCDQDWNNVNSKSCAGRYEMIPYSLSKYISQFILNYMLCSTTSLMGIS